MEVLPQKTTVAANQPKNTFGRHNGWTDTGPASPTFIRDGATGLTPTDETLMTNYDWLVHLDRPLMNPLEILHVTGGKPHELTQQFMTPLNGSVQKFGGTPVWFPPAATPGPPLYRALEWLRIQPYGQQTALSGRLAGRININTIQDKRVWDAAFDASIGNGFTQAQVDQMWTSLMATRTLNMDTTSKRDAAGNLLPFAVPIPGATIYDTNSATGDRPFLPFGTPTLAVQATGYAIGGSTTAKAFGGGSGRETPCCGGIRTPDNRTS